MTIDDDNSIYVGGLPYDATEDDLRRAFEIYGNVMAVKIVNDREIGGKCYGFVTFPNPRSAIDAIGDMNGRTIGGRVVRVNEVRTRGGRPNFRENFRRTGRDIDWDREKGRERDYVRGRDHYRDRNTERSRDRERERERGYEREHDSDQAREHGFDRGQDVEDHDHERTREHDRDWERDRNMDWDRDREMDKTKDHGGDREKDKEYQSRNRLENRPGDRRSREFLSDSSDDYQDEVKEELELSLHRLEELQKELARIQEMVEEKGQLVSDLKRKSQKLEDSLADAKKLSSQQQIMLTKLHRCFQQSQEYAEKLKSSEQELKLLVDTTMAEVDAAEDANTRNGSLYANGQV